MNYLKNFKISYKLLFLLMLFIAGFAIFGIISYFTLEKLKINGGLYNKIIQGKDLVADILPPPEYIIESYLIVLEMVYNEDHFGKDMETYIKAFGILEKKYNSRHKYWTDVLEPGEIKTTLIETSYKPAVEFYKVIDEELIPLIRKNNRESALRLISNQIKPLYDEHRKAIDNVVELANSRNKIIEDDAASSIIFSYIVLLLIFLLISGMTAVISLLTITSVTGPIKTISSLSVNLSEGDLTVTLDDTSKNEIGTMSAYLNNFLHTLNSIITKVKINLDETNGKISQLFDSTDSSRKAADDINNMADQVKTLIISQSAVVSEVSATIEEMVRTIEGQDMKISTQATNVTQSSAAIEELIANIQSIGNNLDNSTKEFANLENAVALGNENVEKLTEMMNSLSHQSDIVDEANSVIKNIAAQTDLLSMNAAIEAAQAGDAGKGFAVVADEIGKLAEISNEQSKLISDNVIKLKNSIALAVNLSSETGNSFELIIKALEKVSYAEKEIMNSLQEQSAGSNQILEALKNIERITEEVHTGSNEMSTGGKSIINEIIGLVDITEKVKKFSLQVVEKADNVKDVVDKTVKILNSNIESMDKVNKEISQFKVRKD